MSCPSGYTYVDKCDSKLTCEDGCDIWGVGWWHHYDRCKDSSGQTICNYVNSTYYGCDCKF